MQLTIIQNRRKAELIPPEPPPISGYVIPAGGEIYWYGTSETLPAEFEIDSEASDMFVRGAGAGDASNEIEGDLTHAHSYSGSFGAVGNHNHTFSTNQLNASSGTRSFFGIANNYTADVGHTHGGGSGTSTNAGGHAHTITSASGNTEFNPLHVKMYLVRAKVDAALPISGIILWNGNFEDRPFGTSVCNGTGDTPDMRNRFVRCAIDDNVVKEEGGSASHSHTPPKHGVGGQHSHTFSVSSGGASATSRLASGYADGTTAASASHGHVISGTLTNDPAHTHSVGNTASASPLPLYIMIYYVMRTSK